MRSSPPQGRSAPAAASAARRRLQYCVFCGEMGQSMVLLPENRRLLYCCPYCFCSVTGSRPPTTGEALFRTCKNCEKRFMVNTGGNLQMSELLVALGAAAVVLICWVTVVFIT